MENQVNEQLKEEIRQNKLERNRKISRIMFIVSIVFLIIGFLSFNRISLFVKYGGDVYRIKSKLYSNQAIENLDNSVIKR